MNMPSSASAQASATAAGRQQGAGDPPAMGAQIAILKSEALRRAGQLQEAAASLRRLVDARPAAAVLCKAANIAAKLRDEALERSCLAGALAAGGLPAGLLQRLVLLHLRANAQAEAVLVLEAVFGEGSPEGIVFWADILCDRLGRADTVVERLRPLAAEAGASWAVHASLGRALHALDRPAEARDALREAVGADPGRAAVWYSLGAVCRHIGLTAEAQDAFEKSLELAPDNARTLRVAGYDHRYERGDKSWARVQAALARAGEFPQSARVEIHYAAAKAFEDVGDLDGAFAHYETAGRLQKESSHWNEAADRRVLDIFRGRLSAARLQLARRDGFPTNKPVFVVGMPRSGTSLIEEIIARHPDAHGAGELRLAAQALNGITIDGATIGTLKGSTEQTLRAMRRLKLRERGQAYVRRLEAIAGREAARIVDKMPGNYLWLGLLEAMLPGSYLVHCRRHPVDSCLSQYKLFFGDEIAYSYDLRDLGRAYRTYAEFMDLWKALLPPDRIHEVRYEELVSSPEAESQRLLAYLDLPWTGACLTPSDHKRAVRTASASQARQPIYQSSVGRWRACARHLAPLLDELGDLVDAYEREAPSKPM